MKLRTGVLLGWRDQIDYGPVWGRMQMGEGKTLSIVPPGLGDFSRGVAPSTGVLG